MKQKWIILILGVALSVSSYAQEKTFKVGIQHGYFTGGSAFQDVVPDKNTGIDISYFISNRFFITAHFNSGKSAYYETSLTNYPDDRLFWKKGSEIRSNADLVLNNIGLLAGYSLPITQWANLTGQIGISQFIQMTKQYPLRIYLPDDERTPYRISNADFTFCSAAFPVKFGLGFTPFKKLNIGLAKNTEIGYVFGFYMEPDYGFFTGVYHGPQLSIGF